MKHISEALLGFMQNSWGADKISTPQFSYDDFKGLKIRRYGPKYFGTQTLNVSEKSAWTSINIHHTSANKLFCKYTGVQTSISKSGKTNSIKIDLGSADFDRLQGWFDLIGEKVILEDLLSYSAALSINDIQDENGKRVPTKFGNLERQAKKHGCEESQREIADEMARFIQAMPYYADADIVCPIPRSSDKTEPSLPEILCDLIAAETKKPSLTGQVQWKDKTVRLEGLSWEERWPALKAAGLQIMNIKNVQGKVVILIDDLYQSGTTLHFVAQELIKNGAKAVLGLAAVKSWSDHDNIIDGGKR